MPLPVPRQRRNVPVRLGLGPWVLATVLMASAVAGCDRPVPASAEDATEATPASTQVVRSGLEVLLTDSLDLVRDRRVGLVTNHTGIDREGVSTIDRLFQHADIDLVALFSPEHGIRGEVEAGVEVDSSVDSQTGLPIHSLYGDTRKPSPEMLTDIDVLVFDIQDIGARYYTYVSTMARAMEAAGEAGIGFVVLDRPNPIGGVAVQGTVLDPEYSTFVGLHPTPMRHGMTPGELALMMVGEFGIEADLAVVPADGWTRGTAFEDTGLPWLAPSPNMPSIESALHYPGTCLFEGTNVSVGRGTDIAFQQLGAPWLDADQLAGRLRAYGFPGVQIDPVTFVPENPGDGKYGDTEVHGVRLTALDDQYDPTRVAVALLVETYRAAGDRWEWYTAHFDRLAGTAALRAGIERGDDVEELTAGWDEALESFKAQRASYLLYPE